MRWSAWLGGDQNEDKDVRCGGGAGNIFVGYNVIKAIKTNIKSSL